MAKQLSNQTSYATEKTNVTGVLSPILTFQPDDGLTLLIQGMVSSGSERGFPVFADLKQADGSDMPEDTTLVFQYKQPRMDDPRTVTHPLDHIRPFNALTLNEQQDEEYIDRVKLLLKNTEQALAQGEMPQINVRDIDELNVSIESSAEIDWAQSRFYIGRNAVQEV